MKKQGLLYLITLVFLLQACSPNRERPKPDISNIEVVLKVKRFEKDLLASKGEPASLLEVQAQYPDFYPVYMQNIMRLSKKNDTITKQSKEISAFLGNKYVRGLFDTCGIQYPNLDKEQKETTEALKYFKHYFPNKPLPQKLISYISEFSLSAMTIDTSILGLGLDMYLGAEYKYYPSIGFPRFMIRKLTRANIVPNKCEQ